MDLADDAGIASSVRQMYGFVRDAVCMEGQILGIPLSVDCTQWGYAPEVWEKIHILKEKGYRIYLLSNYSKYLFEMHTKDAAFMDDLDGRLVSYEVHQVKPDRDIYETLIKRYDLDPKECLFLDDRKENTDTAESLGIKSVTIESRQHVNSVIDDILNGKIS